MPRNASGVYTLPAGNPVVTNTLITSTWANNTMGDLGSETTNSLDRSGRGGMLAALKGIDGSTAAPLYSWTAEPSTGFYRVSAGVIGVSILGANVGNFSATGWSDATPKYVLKAGDTMTGSLTIGLAAGPANLNVRAAAAAAIGSVTVAGNGNTTGVTSFDLQQDATNAYVWQRANAPLLFGTNATEKMRINATGEVGIGGASSGPYLYITGSATGAMVDANSTAANGGYYRVSKSGANFSYFGSAAQLIAGGVVSDLGIRTDGSIISFAIGGSSTKMLLDPTGLLIGSTSRSGVGAGSDLLSVKGSIGLGDGTATVAQINANSTSFAELVNRGAGGGFKMYPNAGSGPAFTMSGTTPYDITAAGIAIVRSKSSTTSRNTTTTLADDPDLSAVLPVGRYNVQAVLFVDATTTAAMGIKTNWTFSGTKNGDNYMMSGLINGATMTNQSVNSITSAINFANVTTVTAAPDCIVVTATIQVTVQGTLTFQWAQNASSGNNLNLRAGSFMTCMRTAF